jgi:hypothetical protein
MSKRPLDLDSLPPDLRRVVEQQLAKLPPAAREKLLREGSPLVEKMIAKFNAGQRGGPPPLPGGQRTQEAVQRAANSVSAAAERADRAALRLERMIPRGHYNATIRPGDGSGGGFWAIALVIAAVFVALAWR